MKRPIQNKSLEEHLKRLRRKRRHKNKQIKDTKISFSNSEEKQRQFKLVRKTNRQNRIEDKQKSRGNKTSSPTKSDTSKTRTKNVNAKVKVKTKNTKIKSKTSPNTKTKTSPGTKKTPTNKVGVKKKTSVGSTKLKSSTPSIKTRKVRSDKGFKRPKRGIDSELKVVNAYTLSKYRRLKEEYLARILNGDVEAAFEYNNEIKEMEREIINFKLQFIRSLDERMIAAFKQYPEKAIEHWYRHPEFQQIFDSLEEFLEYIDLA